MSRQQQREHYLPAVDGLRFVAFLLVFVHHVTPTISPLAIPSDYGWVGVEVFFAISSFLFFTLLGAEHSRAGGIDIPRFFVRRILRIYPLLVLLPTLMILRYSSGSHNIARYVGILTFTENFMIGIDGNRDGVANATHLWTLAYEFQIYLMIPLAFLVYKALGRSRFLVLLVGIWLICLFARAAFVLADVQHPVIWVTPFLRPESTLLGMAIALGVGRERGAVVVAAVLAGAVALLVTHPNVQEIGFWTLAIYPVCGVIAGCALLLALRSSGMVGRLLSHAPVVYLGTISYGLYVYHLLAISLVDRALLRAASFGDPTASELYPLRFVLALLVTIAMATLSWFAYERWFLQLKTRFAAAQ